MPGQRRPSAAPSLQTEHEPSPAPSAALSPLRSPSRSSRASTSSQSSRDPDKLTPTQVENLTRSANEAFATGSSLADHIRRVVCAYSVNKHAAQSERPAVDELERNLDDLGPQASFSDVHTATRSAQNVPSGLRKRLALVFRTYAHYITRGHSNDQGSTTSTPAVEATAIAAAAAPALNEAEHAAGTHALEAVAPQESAEEAEAKPASATDGGGSRSEQTLAIDSATALETEEPSAEVPVLGENADDDQMQIESAGEITAQESTVAHDEHDQLAGAGHDSTVDSAGSLQAFGTPPEQPVEDPEEAEEGSDDGAGEVESAPAPVQAEKEVDELEEEDKLVDEVIGDSNVAADDDIQASRHDVEINDDHMTDDHSAAAQPADANEDNSADKRQPTPTNEDSAADQLGDDQPATAQDQQTAQPPLEDTHHDQQHEQQRSGQEGQQDVPNEQQQSEQLAGQHVQIEQQDRGERREQHGEQEADQQERQQTEQQEEQHVQSEPEDQGQHSGLQQAKQQEAQQGEPQEEQQGEQQSQQPLDGQLQQRDEQQDGGAPQSPNAEVEAQHADQSEPQSESWAPQPVADSVADEPMEAAIQATESAQGQAADQVATAVEEAEQALEDKSDAQPDQFVDAPAAPSATVPVANAGDAVVDQQPPETVAPAGTSDDSRTAPAQDLLAVDSAAADSSSAIGPDPIALPAVTETDEQMPDAAEDPALQIPAASSSIAAPPLEGGTAETVETSTEAPTAAASVEPDQTGEHNAPVPAAAVALANIPEAISSSQEAASASIVAPAEVGADVQQQETAQAVSTPNEPTAAPTTEVQVEETVVGPSREARDADRASSQAALESTTPATRRKKTIADRMKSMLKDLASVTNRKSSYDTIQVLKPLRKGQATERTVADLVERWQDPANMIPWTCLQEIGPGILHPKAQQHMDLSMHELMDKVSNTRSVKYLTQKLPERVITRALMELPRVPHMLHCWNNEKHKYFVSRGLPQPTDTQPEFRFADAAEGETSTSTANAVAASTPASTSRASAPPPVTTSSLHLGIPEKKPQLARAAGSASPMSAPAMTQSHSVPPPSNNEIGRHQQPIQPQMQSRPLSGNSVNGAVPRQLLNNAGSLALGPNQRQLLQMLPANLPPAQPVQQLSLSLLEQQQRQQILIQQQQQQQPYRQFQPAAPAPPPPQQQLTSRQAFQNQATQPTPHRPSLEEAIEQQQRLLQQQHQQRRQQEEQQRLLQLQRQQEEQQRRLQQQRQQKEQQRLQQQQQSNAARVASAVRAAANAVFSGLVADCVSFAEHVLGSGAVADEIVSRNHFSESEVLHVVQYVLKVYKDEVDVERSAGRQNQSAEEKYAKILKAQEAALRVISLTKTLLGIKMCVTEAVHDALRTNIGATLPPVIHWQDLLSATQKYKGIVEYLMRGEPMVLHRLSTPERRMLLHAKVVAVNRDLESTLEKMVTMDDLIGIRSGSSGDNAEGEDDKMTIRRECEMIAGICCKHVVGILGE